MRVTIIADDSAVYVDGEAITVDLAGIDPDIHAIQWYDTWGEVEFTTDFSKYPPTRKPNMFITDLSPYQVFVDRRAVAVQKRLASIVTSSG